MRSLAAQMNAPKVPGADYEVKTDRVGPPWRRRWSMSLVVTATGYRTPEAAAEDLVRVATGAAQTATEEAR